MDNEEKEIIYSLPPNFTLWEGLKIQIFLRNDDTWKIRFDWKYENWQGFLKKKKKQEN